MAEDEKTPETEETPDSVKEEVDTAASAEGAGDTSTVDTPEEAPAEETPAGKTPAEEAPAPAAEAAAPAEPSAAEGGRDDERSEAGEVLAPKERRARRRAAKAPAASGAKTPEERNAERLAARAHKAKLRRNYRERAKTKHAEARKGQTVPEPDVAPEHGPGRAKVRQGIVVSDKADKTIVVRVDVTRRHRRYGKIMRTSSKIHAHDERNDAGTGDTVRVVECRPMSRTKRWRLTDVLEKAK
jgi:small subunit ribosomal protein S17